MFRRVLNIAVLLTLFAHLNGQTGGDNTYEFLNLTHSGLVASLGGSNVSLQNDNLNLSFHNPALLTSDMGNRTTLNYVNYLADVNYGLALYSWQVSNTEGMAAGVSYYSYGSFTEADVTGVITGTFTASEFSFPVVYSRRIDTLFNAGITFKPILSHLEKYSSFGFAIDLGASYHNPANLFSAGITLRNMGLQLTKYASEERMRLPFEIEVGISQKLPHAPFRFSVTARHLEKYNLINTEESASSNNDFLMGSKIMDNALRHLVFGVELLPHENFYFSGGYNYQRRRELGISEKLSGVGLSWGFGINTSAMNIEFARSTYHLAGASTHISMILKLNKIYGR